MSRFDELGKKLVKSMEIPGLKIPIVGIKLFFAWDAIPESVLKYQPEAMTVTSCHAIKAAMLEDAVYLTRDSIGCVAAAISLGLVNEDQTDQSTRRPASTRGPRRPREPPRSLPGKPSRGRCSSLFVKAACAASRSPSARQTSANLP